MKVKTWNWKYWNFKDENRNKTNLKDIMYNWALILLGALIAIVYNYLRKIFISLLWKI